MVRQVYNYLRKLLAYNFPGNQDYLRQLDGLECQQIDKFGSLQFRIDETGAQDGNFPLPVEAEYFDEDGVPVWIFLHESKGRLWEYEVVKADLSDLKQKPEAGRLTVRTLGTGKPTGKVEGYRTPE